MIGRMAYHEPYRLHLLDCAIAGREPRAREDLLRAYLPYVEAQLARGVAIKHITRHILGLYQGEPGARGFRRQLSEGSHLPGADWSLIESALAPFRRAA